MKERKNIILLMTDQQRYDHVSYIKNGKLNTPNMDRIAQGMAFTCCQTVNPVCAPARTALITGKYPHQIGTLSMSGDLSLQHPTFMQALQKAGYHTSGIGKFHFLQTWPFSTPRGKGLNLVKLKDKIKKYGYDYVWESAGKQLAVKNYCDYCQYLEKKGILEDFRDFVQKDAPNFNRPDTRPGDKTEPWPFDEKDYIDVVTTDKIIERIENRPKDKPFYIFGSFCGPHKPFDPPKRYLDMFPYEEIDDFIPSTEGTLSKEDKEILYRKRQAYKAMIKLIDDEIGRIFNTLEHQGLLENTVIILTSDHGEMMGDHFRIEKQAPWKEASTVPTAIRHPEYLLGSVNNSPVEITDLTATILDIAGLDAKTSLSLSWPAFNDIVPSRSLLPILTGEKHKVRDFTFTENNGKWQMIQTEKYKYIRYLTYEENENPKELFFDLVNNPNETENQINNKKYSHIINLCREHREWVMDTTPPAQTSWAPWPIKDTD